MAAPEWFNAGYWHHDPAINGTSLATQGLWTCLLIDMHLRRADRVRGTLVELAHLLRATPAEVDTALGELEAAGVVRVLRGDGLVVISESPDHTALREGGERGMPMSLVADLMGGRLRRR
jgi:hypothetical protein